MLSSVSWEHYKDIKPLDNPLRAIPMREKKKVSKELKKEGENRQEHLPLTPCLGMSYYVNFLGGLGSNEFDIK